MNAVTKIVAAPARTAASNGAPAYLSKQGQEAWNKPLHIITGAGKAARDLAFHRLAGLAFAEAATRAELVAAGAAFLGKSPSEDDIKAFRREAVIGRTACRLPAASFPKAVSAGGDKIAWVRDQFENYVAPAVEGKKAAALPKGKAGRRTVPVHKALRAAEEYASKLLAEIGHGGAQTNKAMNDKAKDKRAPHRNASPSASKDAAKPTHEELIKPTGPKDAAAVMADIMQLTATLDAYAKKHAALVPTTLGEAINAVRRVAIAEDGKRRVELEHKDGIKAEAKPGRPARKATAKAAK